MKNMKKKKKIKLEQIGILIVMLALFLFIFVPVWSALTVSFMSNAESLAPSTYIWPSEFSLDGYRAMFEEAQLMVPIVNTVVVTFFGTIFHMIICSLAAYALIQKSLPGYKYILVFFMLTMMVPPEAIMIPRYIMFQEMGLINHLVSLILVSLASGFSILLLENYFKDVPDSLAESARIDGASEFKIFSKLYIPLAKNGFLVVMLFDIVNRWNEYSNALILITDPDKYVIQQAVKQIVLPVGAGDSSFMIYPNLEMATVVFATVPILILYVLFQNQFVNGASAGGVKE